LLFFKLTLASGVFAHGIFAGAEVLRELCNKISARREDICENNSGNLWLITQLKQEKQDK